MQVKKNTGEGSILADVTRSAKQGISGPTKRTSNFFKNLKNQNLMA